MWWFWTVTRRYIDSLGGRVVHDVIREERDDRAAAVERSMPQTLPLVDLSSFVMNTETLRHADWPDY
jgi:hypothetical protein